MNRIVGKLSVIFLLASGQVFAASYTVPPPSESLIGRMQYSSTGYGETNIKKIDQEYDVGYNAMQGANPHLDLTQDLPSGSPLQIPTQHLLPNEPREGIVINLPEMRMYYYPAGTGKVLTYPIGIGKVGKTIPITLTSITKKVKDPIWTPPEDIREFNLQQGIVLPSVMPAGPDNPLGPYAIYMKVPTYLIHSTIFPESIGKRASFGCIRMYESDIYDFFPSIQPGIPVAIVNSPVIVGWQDNRLYMESYAPLIEHSSEYDSTLPGAVHKIVEYTSGQPVLIDWQAVAYIAQEQDGVPHEIGTVMRMQTGT